MEQFRLSQTLACAVFSTACLAIFFVAGASAQKGLSGEGKHGFGVKQYKDFHDVLHPLEHEALPNSDFARIRSQSALLRKRGKAIVKLGVPPGMAAASQKAFAAELNKFKEALARFKTDAKKGTNDQLKTSFGDVHDSFEMLAGMLPRS